MTALARLLRRFADRLDPHPRREWWIGTSNAATGSHHSHMHIASYDTGGFTWHAPRPS